MSLQCVERTATVLLAFTSGEPVLGVSEVARRVELPKSAVHRIMDSLAGSGLLARDETGTRYRLGPRASELAIAAFGSRNVPALALPVMEELARQSGETTTLSLLVGRERVYAQQVESAQDVRMTVEVGRRYPLYAGASGRAILAFLPAAERESYLETTVLQKLTEATVTEVGPLRERLEEVRRLGFAMSLGERDAWAAAVAAPLRVGGGAVIGSLSICGPLGRFAEGTITEHGKLVRAAADRISARLG